MRSILSRRALFGGATAAALLGSEALARSRKVAVAHQPYSQIGVQLYTVRDAYKADPLGTLQMISALGFNEVEMIGLNDHKPAEIKGWLDGLGLKARSGHLGDWTIRAEGGMDDLAALGASYAVIPWLPVEQRTEWEALGAKLNSLGELAKARGLKLAYHNHDFEFLPSGGKLPYDILRATTDPALVWFELDVYWATHGGQNAVTMMNRDPSRFRLLHLKDMGKDGSMAPVGKGIIDFKSVLAMAHKNGVEFVFVEHDNPANPFDSINQSIKYLRSI